MKRIAIAGLVMATAAPAGADTLRGWMHQPLQESTHTVQVKLDGGVARLTVRRTFHNLGEIPEEANVDLTLPPGAVASALRLRTKAGWEAGTLMDARAAVDEYEELTGIGDHKILRDPALLEWLDVGYLSLRVFPVPPGGNATVEYDVVMPTAYEDGRVVLYYTEPSGAESANLIAPTVTGDQATVTRGAILPEDLADIDEEDGNADGLARWTRIAVPAPAIDVVAARYGVFTVNKDTGIWRLELDAAADLVPKPKKARVAFVIDASVSVGAAGIKEQIALARGYMANLPDAKYDVILFRREAARVAGKFVSVDDLERALVRAASLDQLRPGNGSNMETGLAAAADALAAAKAVKGKKDKAASRIVVFTDGAMRVGFSPSLAVALLERAPERTVVHIVLRPSSGEAIFLDDESTVEPLAEERADEGPLAAVAASYGGVSLQITGRGETPADYARIARGLVQPIRIDDFAVRSDGLELDNLPTTLEAGAGVRHMESVSGPSGVVRLSGKLWADRWSMEVPIDGAYSQRVGTLLFGDSVVRELDEEDARRLAMAAQVVSPYTSYLAIEPGVQPSVKGVDRNTWQTIASGLDDSNVYGGLIGDGGDGYTDLQKILEDMLQPAAVSCGALELTKLKSGEQVGRLDIEATDQEVVDVRVDGAASALVGSCLMEQAWLLALGEQFSGHVTHRAELVVQ